MKALLIMGSFLALYILFWLITTPITILKVFIQAMAEDASEDAA